MLEQDINLFIFLNQLFSPPGWTAFFSVATGFGNGLIQALLIIPGMYFLGRHKFRSHLPALVITAAVGGLGVVAVKMVVARPRPPAYFATHEVDIHTPLGEPSDYSFPSGHTQTAFSSACYLSFLYPALTPVFLGLATLVGVSRVALGVHFPLDVIVGALMGFGFALAGYRLNLRRLDWAKKKKTT